MLFDEERLVFTCPCRKGSSTSWSTWNQYNEHRLKEKKDICHLQSFVPQCPKCCKIMLNPKLHYQEFHDEKLGSLEPQFEQLKWETCFRCHQFLLHTTLTQSHIWRSHLYCKNCFVKECKPVIRINKLLLKHILLEKTNFSCCLCEQTLPLSTLNQTIFEHVNPYTKGNVDVSEMIWKGHNLSLLLRLCQEENILLAHQLCATLKTWYEKEAKEYKDKTWLTKARNQYKISNEAYEEARLKKEHYYAQVVLPRLKKKIQDCVSSKFSVEHEHKHKRKHKRKLSSLYLHS